jgi:hypothetical protein
VSLALALAAWREPAARLRAAGMVLMFAGLGAACQGPQPAARTYFDFMDDGIARDGVLARCNQDRDATLNDVECSNARRAAAAIALDQERARSERFARQSERKLAALRDRTVREQQAEEESEAVARADAEAAYERLWRKPDSQQAPAADGATPDSVSAFGAPLGPLLPSIIADDPALSDGRPPSRPPFTAAAIEPPSNAVEIVRPEVRREDMALVPEHLHAAAN